MSFILDAIAKSEQERQQHEVPSAQILALPNSSVQKPRRVLPNLVVGALLLNAILLVIWIQSDWTFLKWSSPTLIDNNDRLNQQAIVSEDRIASVQVTANATTAKVVADVENIEPTNRSRADRPGEIPISTRDNAAGPVSEAETLQPEPVAALTSGDTTSTGVTSNAISPKLGRETATRLESESESETSGDTNTWERVEQDSLSKKASAEQQAALNTDLLQPKISRLSDLPRAVRDDLPTVVFSGHLYSSNPDSSFVFLDGSRPVKKGQQIANDLFLHDITPTGVIVEFRGYLIDVGVLQNWTLN